MLSASAASLIEVEAATIRPIRIPLIAVRRFMATDRRVLLLRPTPTCWPESTMPQPRGIITAFETERLVLGAVNMHLLPRV
jgi:hypothetical protein